MNDDDRMKNEEFEDKTLASMLDAAGPIVAGDAFRAQLLTSYDEFHRRKKRGGFAGFAEAIGWRPLGRPWAPAGIASLLIALGFLSGAASASARMTDDEAYAYVADAYDQTFSIAPETPSWVEE
ncbi:MAG: hypothetical protein R3C60_06205 [Parvularculaceae bacterium]